MKRIMMASQSEFSKLPVRQVMKLLDISNAVAFSKLPVRQVIGGW